MPRGYEWLISWYTAETIWQRAVAVGVKTTVEVTVVAVVATVLFVFPAGMVWGTPTIDVGPQVILSGWAALVVLLYRAEHCFTTESVDSGGPERLE